MGGFHCYLSWSQTDGFFMKTTVLINTHSQKKKKKSLQKYYKKKALENMAEMMQLLKRQTNKPNREDSE